MSDEAFRSLLDVFMCADPWPYDADPKPLEDFLDAESRERGYMDWISAYHDFALLPPPPAEPQGDTGKLTPTRLPYSP